MKLCRTRHNYQTRDTENWPATFLMTMAYAYLVFDLHYVELEVMKTYYHKGHNAEIQYDFLEMQAKCIIF